MYTIRRPPIKNVSLFTNVSQGRGHENVVEVHIQHHVILHRMCQGIKNVFSELKCEKFGTLCSELDVMTF